MKGCNYTSEECILWEVALLMNMSMQPMILGGRLAYSQFCFCSGEGKGESEAPGRGGRFFLKSPGGVSWAGGGGEGPEGCLGGILGGGGG